MEKSLTDPPPSNSRESPLTLEMINKVFGLEELREKILDFVIHDKRKVLIPSVRSCRLVSKTWLRSTSSVLFKFQEPLFRFHLREENSRTAQDSEQPLDQFVATAMGAGRQFLDGRVPPFAIKATCDIFEEKKYQNFFDCLAKCGDGLVELDLQFPKKGHLGSVPLTSYSFPKLRFLRMIFYKNNSRHDEQPSTIIINKRIDFAQSVFDSSKQITSFVFCYVPYAESYPQNHFRNLKYPSTLKHLNLQYVGNDDSLLVLARTPLPHLKTLRLFLNVIPYNDGLIFSILQNVRKTLTHFRVRHCLQPVDVSRRRSTTFQLPLMEKLELLEIGSRYLELEGNCSSLQKLVPVLKSMSLNCQALSTFQKWTEKSCFHSVNSLAASLNAADYANDAEIREVNFDLGTMATLNMAFPNITKLSIRVNATEMPASVLWEMTKLQHLQIYVFGAGRVYGPEVWDSFLTGIPKRTLKNLELVPELWEEFQVVKNVSIRDLADLQSLKLAGTEWFDMKRSLPLISDAAFYFGFLKMPKLTKLVFEENFCATDEMVEKWKEEGRTIETEIYRELLEGEDTDSDDGYWPDECYF